MSKILFFGDSITAGNRSPDAPLGEGYVSVIAEMFQCDSNYEHMEVINSGINGHTVQDLLSRYEEDIVAQNPDHLLIKIGINDAYKNYMDGIRAYQLGNYVRDYDRLLSKLKVALPDTSIRLLTPYFICGSSDDGFYQLMSLYVHSVKALGAKHDLEVFNVQEIFDKAVQIMPSTSLAADRIHPQREGHELIAGYLYEFLDKKI
ncbi:MAG: hypothetical protein K9N38_12330 [Candidatus Marinimicrobia bacterium]|nr:hypothetical protein [Candidatus Neomarinimicrobiota bacterium]